jgi:hypothetical protein
MKISLLTSTLLLMFSLAALAAIKPGVSEAQVLREMGKPSGSMVAGKSRILFFPQWEITITNGFVASVDAKPVPLEPPLAPIGAAPLPVAARSHAPAAAQPGAMNWPPAVNQPYPDLVLYDYTGRRVQLSSFKGKIILVEPVGMPCGGCQAYSGAHKKGALGGVAPQADLRSIDEYFPLGTGGITLTDERIVFVQLVLYGPHLGAPTLAEGKRWAEHFGFDAKPNHIVLLGTPEMQSRASFDMIPGFHLIDRNFVLRGVNVGHDPHSDLNRDVLALVPKLLPRR